MFLDKTYQLVVDSGALYGAKVRAARAGRVVVRQWSPEGYGFW
jgi:murein DD-endopeptidase MepM/ murein hydrolase activator NlpD